MGVTAHSMGSGFWVPIPPEYMHFFLKLKNGTFPMKVLEGEDCSTSFLSLLPGVPRLCLCCRLGRFCRLVVSFCLTPEEMCRGRVWTCSLPRSRRVKSN